MDNFDSPIDTLSNDIVEKEDDVDSQVDQSNSISNNEELSCGRKIINLLSIITIEPIIFLNVFAWMLQGSLCTNMLLEKVCTMNFNYSHEICANLSDYTNEQIKVQKVVTDLNMYTELLTNLPSVIFVLFIGPWSDRHGRKIPLLIPLIGCFLKTLIYMINVYFWSLPPEYIILTGIPGALTGGFAVFLMACFSYISDLTTISSRTTRIAFADLMMAAGAPTGIFFSMVVYNSLGYIGVYMLSMIIFIFCILYVIFRLEETRGPHSKYSQNEELIERSNNRCSNLFDINHVVESISIFVKKREYNGRYKIIVLTISLCLIVFTFGSGSLDYLFVRKMFKWDYNQYCIYSFTSIGIGILGASIVFPLLSLKLQIDDSILGLIGCVSKASDYAMRLFATSSWYMYAGAGMGFVGGIPTVISRSVVSKTVPPSEVGGVFAVIASGESIVPLFAAVSYTYTYNATLSFMPAAIYFINLGIFIISFFIFLSLVWIKQREIRSRQSIINYDILA